MKWPRFLKFVFVSLTLLFHSTVFSQSVNNQEFYWVHIAAPNQESRSVIASMIHIDQIVEDSVYAMVNVNEMRTLQTFVPGWIREYHAISPAQYSRHVPGFADSEDIEFPRGEEAYHTYREVVSKFSQLAQTYSNIAVGFSIGKSVEGRDIIGLRITGNKDPGQDAFVPGIIFLGTHHAREHLSTEMPVYLAEYLLSNYETDQRVKNLIDTRDIYIIPMVNPDGAMHDIKGRRYKMWRKNRTQNSNGSYGVDLNRNYSFGWGTGGSSRDPNSQVYMGPAPFSEPETQAVKAFVESRENVRIMLTFHTFSELILYPWGGRHPGVGGQDQQVFETMATTMAQWNGYRPMQSSELYIASGDTCDWAYGEHNIFCFTFELTPKSMFRGGFYPGTGVIGSTVNKNIAPAMYLIHWAGNPYGVLNPSMLFY